MSSTVIWASELTHGLLNWPMMTPDQGKWPRVWCRMIRSVLEAICFLGKLFILYSMLISETEIDEVAPVTLIPMEIWKKCRFDFQTCLHSNQDYSETVKDISSEKIRHLENCILHNRPVPKFAPFPQGSHKKKSWENMQDLCPSLYDRWAASVTSRGHKQDF